MKIENLILQIFVSMIAVSVIGLTPTQIDSIEKIYSMSVKYPSVFPLTDDDKIWIENKVKELGVRDKCAQLIMPAVYRDDLLPSSSGYDKFISLVKNEKVGGMIFFQGDMSEQINFIKEMQRIADIPLLISSDFERGLGTRIDDGLEFPHSMAFGSTRNSDYALKAGKIIALESRQIGFHQNFAPVADINNNPMNPIINIRSFSEDKVEVAKFVNAFIEGAKETRFISTVKHFPGHGNTTIDSHYDLPRIEGSKHHLTNNELYPFIEAIKVGVQAIMIGHLEVPSLEVVKDVPSSLSKSIVTHLLKNELKFDGLIVTDAMIMEAITKFYSTEDASVAAFEAGNDIILMPGDEIKVIDALEAAVNSGRITLERLDESVRKILAAKKWLNIESDKVLDNSLTNGLKDDNPNRYLARRIAEESITLLKNENNILPIKLKQYRNIYCITLSDNNWNKRAEYFQSIFKERVGIVNSQLLTGSSRRSEYSRVLSDIDSADLIIIPSFIDVKTYKGPVNLSAEQIDFISGVLKKDIPTILISFRNPYLIYLFPDAKVYLNAFSHSYPSQDAMLRALLGEITVKGKMPVTIPNSELVYGSGLELEKSKTSTIDYELIENFSNRTIDEQVELSISEKVFPGAVILAAKDGSVFYHKAFGTSGFGSNNYVIQRDDVFSVGRLTNLFTIACALKLIDNNVIAPEDKLSLYFDNITDPEKRNITLKNLLLHNSGYSTKLSKLNANWKKEDLIINILGEDLDYETGFENHYSSINLILLQEIIEKFSGEKLPGYFEKNFRIPLNIFKSAYTYVRDDSIKFFYNPKPIIVSQAKTQEDLINNILKGERGSTSGFDGFYTNAIELALFSQMILQNGFYHDVQVLSGEVVENWLNGFEATKKNVKRKYEFIDPGGCSFNLNYDKNYFIIVLTNANIKNPGNQSFVNFSKKIFQIFDSEFSEEIF